MNDTDLLVIPAPGTNGFVKWACAFHEKLSDAGIGLTERSVMMRDLLLASAMEKDPSFRAGVAMKVASAIGDAATGASDPLKGGVLGGLGGLAAGALRRSGRWGRVAHGVGGVLAGTGLGKAWQGWNSGERRLKNMWQTDQKPWYMEPGSAVGGRGTGGGGSGGVAQQVSTSLHGGGAGGAKGNTYGAQRAAEFSKRLKLIDADLASARESARGAGSGLSGSVAQADALARARGLEEERRSLLNESKGFIGQMRRDQGRGLSRIDKLQADGQSFLASNADRAAQLEAAQRRVNNGGAIRRWLFNITGGSDNVRRLEEQRRVMRDMVDKRLPANRAQFESMLPNL